MNKIEQLIEELCPQGVEFKTLGEVIKLKKGKQLNKEFLSENGLYPAYNGGISYSGFTNNYNYNENTIIISQGGASAGFVNFVTTKFYANAHCYVVLTKTEVVKNRYAYHFLKLNQEKLTNKQHGAGIPALKTSEVLDIPIPIPPLTIQKEIVKILDNFTRLEAELKAELEARKKQYEHYREELLSFGDDVEFRALGEVGKFLRGSAITKKETTVGEIPVVANAPIPICFHGESNRAGETIVVSRSGANCGLVSFWKQPIFVTDAFSIHLETALLKPKFIYYFLKKNQKTIHSMKKGYGVPHVRVKDFEPYPVPIPPLSKQKKIVAILDKFDALVNDISTGLPAEIAARKKQYEYYRNQLLTFKPLETQDVN
ncbi:restriction endonuclease subunit S [Desulfococcaceae bacterium HSG9]|nr:restriction endonuclease subunit S [Desulfococcaceae bacterium HSG9]